MRHAASLPHLAAIGMFLGSAAMASAQLTADEAAAMLLSSARKAYNEKNHAFAAARFREFLAKHPGHKETPAARFGLALSLLEGPDKNFAEARDHLQHLAGITDFAERHQALYHLGLAIRGQGIQALQAAEAKPAEAGAHRAAAQKRFEEAAVAWLAARAALEKRASSKVPAEAKELPEDHEWLARVRCDQAENFLRLNQPREAREAVALFQDDPVFTRSRFRDRGRYFLGYAAFLLKDYPQAGRSLVLLAPFTDPGHGGHARYLLGRTHHLQEERGEAAHHYEASLADHARRRDEAAGLLKEPAKFKNDPVVRAELEAFLKETPDHVARASFYLGVLLYESGRFGEALARFADFPKTFLFSPLRSEAELRLGFCQLKLKAPADAIKTLSPLIEREPRLADQALLWIARAHVEMAPDPRNEAHAKTLALALATLRQAADHAQRLAAADPDARERRGQVLLDIADVHQLLGQHREAATTYSQLLNEKALPDRVEDVWLRWIQALHFSGDPNESDAQAARFGAAFPRSALLPHVLFVQAENSYARAQAAQKLPNPAERAREVGRHQDETVKRLAGFVERFPDFPRLNAARFSLGLTLYRQGELEKAHEALEQIPQTDRTGELATASFLLADCILRRLPAATPADDALAIGRIEERLKQAVAHLEAFLAQPAPAQAGDALLQLGLAQQRLAGLMAQPAEKQKALAAARATYERLFAKEFAGHAASAHAVLERAKVIGQAGDVHQAINELRRFQNEPLRSSPPAAMALVHLATLLRGQGKAADAADVLGKARAEHEAALAKDAERRTWIAILRHHHGVALREAGKLPEARALFDAVVKEFPARPEAGESALRLGQCLKDEGRIKLEAAGKLRAAAKKADDFAQAARLEDEGLKSLRDAAAYLEAQSEGLRKIETLGAVRGRMLYDAAWTMRELAAPELEAARKARVEELVKKLGPAAKAPPPRVTLDQLPMQPAEKKAVALYRMLVDSLPDLPLAVESRFELAEMLAARDQHEAALKLLGEALDREPGQDLTEKIRLRMGDVHAARGNLKAALAQFDAVAANPKSPLAGWAHYHAGEAHLGSNQAAEALKRLSVFRDNAALHNVAGLSDRAFLRLGHALALTRSWEESRAAHERVVAGFPSSPWLDEARYGIGWALQHQGRFDEAVGAYAQVTARTAAEVAAKAQMQIGLCRLEQKRYAEAATALLVVPFTYDYPDLCAAALLEAARALAEDRKTDQAARLLERVLRDYPETPFSDAAMERLRLLKK